MLEQVCILGSTGSIGCSSLEVISNNRDRYCVSVLTANANVEKLFQQCVTFKPEQAVMACETSAEKLQKLIDQSDLNIEVHGGINAINQAPAFPQVDITIAAIVGAAGLLPTLTAVRQGHKILLANKEALVMSGELFIQEVKKSGATLLPVDSEHNAIFQSLPQPGNKAQPSLAGVEKILLTGSGGPFLKDDLASLVDKTPEQACAHPNWDMGRKISVDSATMMNKGLELIEACYLFNVGIERIQIIIHPQSIIHSMVSYLDGSVIAQMGNPDMKTPIAHCLAWPDRINASVKPLDFYQLVGLEFDQPDFERFPCLKLAIDAIKIGQSAPCVLNAANEVAVAAFLNGEIKFTEISQVIQDVFAQTTFKEMTELDKVIEVDFQTRELAQSIINESTIKKSYQGVQIND